MPMGAMGAKAPMGPVRPMGLMGPWDPSVKVDGLAAVAVAVAVAVNSASFFSLSYA